MMKRRSELLFADDILFRFCQSVSVVEGIHAARPADLLRLPRPLRFPDRLHFGRAEAVLLHHVRNGRHLFRRPGLLLRPGVSGGRRNRGVIFECGKVAVFFITETQK